MKKVILLLVFLSAGVIYSYSISDIFYMVFTGQYEKYEEAKKDILNISQKDDFGRNLLTVCTVGMVNFKNKNSGSTALHVAAENNDNISIKLLLKKGADPNLFDSRGRTPYYIVVNNGNDVGAEYLAQEMRTYTGNEDKAGVTFYLKENYFPIVKDLVDKGADINEQDNTGRNALHYAVLSGYLPVVEYLIENGANINKLSQKGKTPLIMASEKGFVHIVQYLTDKGAEVNIAYKNDSDSSNGDQNSDGKKYYAEPKTYNFKLVISSDMSTSPDDDKRCYYKVYVNKVEVGRTQIGLESQKKSFTAKLDANRHLISVEKYILDEKKNRYVKVNNIYQPKPSFVYVETVADRILLLTIYHKQRNVKSLYSNRFLLEGES